MYPLFLFRKSVRVLASAFPRYQPCLQILYATISAPKYAPTYRAYLIQHLQALAVSVLGRPDPGSVAISRIPV